MVGATPWKQQIMLLIGVVVAAVVIGPALELLFHAYGVGGVYPHPGMDPTQMLAAPQAGLVTAVTQGVFGNSLAWTDISVGIGIAVIAIIMDEFLKRKKSAVARIGHWHWYLFASGNHLCGSDGRRVKLRCANACCKSVARLKNLSSPEPCWLAV